LSLRPYWVAFTSFDTVRATSLLNVKGIELIYDIKHRERPTDYRTQIIKCVASLSFCLEMRHSLCVIAKIVASMTHNVV
jgi:hypothetical protein